jgi:hypothetical protein
MHLYTPVTVAIRELMSEQRVRARSDDVAKRFAAGLLIPGALRERLRELSDYHVGQVLERRGALRLEPATATLRHIPHLGRKQAWQLAGVGMPRAGTAQ